MSNLQSVKKYHEKLNSMGLCIRCRNSLDGNKTICPSCSKNGLVKRKARFVEGICKSCLKKSVCKNSKSYCERCLDLRRRANKKYNQSHRKENYSRTANWIQRNPEKHKEQVQRYRKKHKASIALKSKIWKQSESGRISTSKYRLRHKEQINRTISEWRKRNRDRVIKNQRNWLSRHPEKSFQYSKKYRTSHPEQVTKSSRARRELFKNIEGDFNLSEWEEICNKFQNRCLYCERDSVKLTIDHVVPVSRGGSNYITNIQPLCKNCNSKKGKKILDFRPFGRAILDWT